MSVVTPAWCADIVAGYTTDPQAKMLLTKLTTKPDSIPQFSLDQGPILHKDRLWVGNNTSLQLQIIQALHSSPIGGHSGIPATIKRIQSLFSWPGLRKHVLDLVHSCSICQQAKPERVKYPGLLQPLATPSSARQESSL